MAFENVTFRPRIATTEATLRAVSDPTSGVIAMPARNRPKRRRHASRLLAKDLALMPVANTEDQGRRTERSKPLSAQRKRRFSPFLTYLSTVLAATALGVSISSAVLVSTQADGSSGPALHPVNGPLTAMVVRAT